MGYGVLESAWECLENEEGIVYDSMDLEDFMEDISEEEYLFDTYDEDDEY